MTTLTHKRFETHIEKVLDSAFRMALHLCHDEDHAADLVQESAFRAFRAFHTFEEGTYFRAWYFRIMTNLYLEWSRKKQREPVVSLDDETPFGGDHPAEAALTQSGSVWDRLETEEVHTAIRNLPKEYRLVSILYFIDEMSYQEIADIAGCPVGTVRSRLHRGRQLLKRTLRHEAEQHGLVSCA
ncbi:MAG: sigma-70 family RNA polymerase sigma factor [candidate division Zixibacteria bacterium]|nr:sigma-70 family RNA polymerase sigma factor [candidate division Zixibacteria bacterium]